MTLISIKNVNQQNDFLLNLKINFCFCLKLNFTFKHIFTESLVNFKNIFDQIDSNYSNCLN